MASKFDHIIFYLCEAQLTLAKCVFVLIPHLSCSGSASPIFPVNVAVILTDCVSSPPPSERTSVSNLTRQGAPGVGRMEWIIPLMVVSALTFVCLSLLLAVLVYWRWVP